MDDEVVGGWRIDPDMRAQLRVDRVKKALDQADFAGAVIEAEELLDEEPEHPEGLFLLAEALLELGDAEGAADAYASHLEKAPASPAALCGLAVARFESLDFPGSVEAAKEAIRLAPDLAEAHYYLGLALERLSGRKKDAVGALMAAHQLDPEAYPLPVQVSKKQWDDLLARAIRQLHPSLREFWEGVPMRFEAEPPLDELRATDPPITPTVSGLYEGSPPVDGDPWDERPQAMRWFMTNLSRLGRLDAIIEEIARTLQNEALDWLELTLEELDDPR